MRTVRPSRDRHSCAISRYCSPGELRHQKQSYSKTARIRVTFIRAPSLFESCRATKALRELRRGTNAGGAVGLDATW